ncbi:Hypothetical protein LUCI_2632 [Lucifera butyrica]|uniref:HD-GYP domain-containing protein n=1 Tax=Lucifera butyrica TaxID=1351585 RepID=A0A498RDX2_9FIRM|nr:HD domain-containing phosphohydrolase [Lucifera butyrica]VBB07388.1 Hypothetical protein LUCI_2632 [Lucifera butyrica]
MQFDIHPLNLMKALSLSLELSTGGLSRHHWRTAMIAARIAGYLKLDDWQYQTLVYAALLHDIGAASNWTERKQVYVLDGTASIHAQAGYQLLNNSPKLGMLAEPIRYHHVFWDGSNSPDGLAGPDIPLLSRIISIADTLEVLIKDKGNILEQKFTILSFIRQLNGKAFDPELVRIVHELARQESFWLDLVNPYYYQNFFHNVDFYGKLWFTIDDLQNIGEIFATIIDRTSRFTARHSRSVSIVASFLAKVRGFSAEEVQLMRIAGLFHDLGKLAVPNHILEKPGKLTDGEYAVIKQHVYYTYRILEQIDGFQMIAEWAAYHHETLDGSGYPFRVGEASLRLGSRIVAVADVFVALTEERPYRQPLDCRQVEKIMRTMVDNRKLDGKIVEELFLHCDRVYSLLYSSRPACRVEPAGA